MKKYKIDIFKISIIFTVITFLSKFIGLFRDSLIARTYGATYITDSYNMSLSIPNIVYMVGIGSILIIFIPTFCEIEKKYGEKEAYKFTNQFMTVLLIISIIMIAIIFLFAKQIVDFIVPGFDLKAKELTITLTRIMSFSIMFSSIIAIFSALARVKNKMIAISILPLMASVPLVTYLLLSNKRNPILLSMITLLGYFLQAMILIPEIRKSDYKYKITFHGYGKKISSTLKNVIPIIFGFASSQISLMVDNFIGSTLEQGSITAIQLSSKVSNIVYAVVLSSVSTIFFPHLSKLYTENKIDEWCEYIENLIKIILIIIVPFTGMLLVLNNDIINFLFKGGAFGVYGSKLTIMALAGYCIQLPFLAITDIIAQGMYSSKEVKRPAYFGILSVILNIILTIIFSKFFNVLGITFATSISSIFCSIMLMNSFNKMYKDFKLKSIIKLFIGISLITILNMILLYYIKLNILNNLNNFCVLLICGVIGVLTQCVLYFIFLRKYFKLIFKFIKLSRK